jgi:hypothetical protein
MHFYTGSQTISSASFVDKWLTLVYLTMFFFKSICNIRCIDPHFLDLGTSWRWTVSFTPRPLYPRGKSPGAHWIGSWVNPRACVDDLEKRKFLTLSRLKLRPLGRPARSQSLYRLPYLGSFHSPIRLHGVVLNYLSTGPMYDRMVQLLWIMNRMDWTWHMLNYYPSIWRAWGNPQELTQYKSSLSQGPYPAFSEYEERLVTTILWPTMVDIRFHQLRHK